MRAVIAGAVGFALGFVILSALFAVIGLSTQFEAGSGQADNWYVGAYLTLVAGACGVIAFALTSAASTSWRARTTKFALVVGAGMALLACLLHFTRLGIIPLILLMPTSLARAFPRVTAFLYLASPGVIAGLVAILIARKKRDRE